MPSHHARTGEPALRVQPSWRRARYYSVPIRVFVHQRWYVASRRSAECHQQHPRFASLRPSVAVVYAPHASLVLIDDCPPPPPHTRTPLLSPAPGLSAHPHLPHSSPPARRYHAPSTSQHSRARTALPPPPPPSRHSSGDRRHHSQQRELTSAVQPGAPDRARLHLYPGRPKAVRAARPLTLSVAVHSHPVPHAHVPAPAFAHLCPTRTMTGGGSVNELRLGFSNTTRNPEGILCHNNRQS